MAKMSKIQAEVEALYDQEFFDEKASESDEKKIVSVDSGRLERVFGHGHSAGFQSPVSARFHAIYDFCCDYVRREIVRADP